MDLHDKEILEGEILPVVIIGEKDTHAHIHTPVSHEYLWMYKCWWCRSRTEAMDLHKWVTIYIRKQSNLLGGFFPPCWSSYFLYLTKSKNVFLKIYFGKNESTPHVYMSTCVKVLNDLILNIQLLVLKNNYILYIPVPWFLEVNLYILPPAEIA